MLLDENMPARMGNLFREHGITVATIADEEWLGMEDEELLITMVQKGYNLLLTLDKQICFEQGGLLTQLPQLDIFILRAGKNTFEFLSELVPRIIQLLPTLSGGTCRTIALH